MLHVFFKIIALNVKTLNYPTLTGFDPFYHLKLVRPNATKEKFTENAEPHQEQLELLTDAEKVPVTRDKDKKYKKRTTIRQKNCRTVTDFRKEKLVRAKIILEIIKNSEK